MRFARHLDGGGGGGRSDGDPLIRASIDSGPSEPGDDDVLVGHAGSSATEQGCVRDRGLAMHEFVPSQG